MNRQAFTEVLVVLLLLAVIFQTVQVLSIRDQAGSVTGAVSAAPTGGPYSGYATYDEMMAAHHGGSPAPSNTIPAGLPQQQGGC
ncbi:MAG: hypothetical protein HY520_05310 [Candidatus Aenigmarchaeota archaeon]|nr:hypothetical protein [Candidatus Aenigmarchaeota archaeon]